MSTPLADVLQIVLSTTLAISPFYIFASMGEIVAEKSGVVNLGIEGIALMSLLTTLIVDFATGNPWLGMLAALGMAGLIGIFFAFLAVQAKFDQIVLGLAIYLFGLGMSLVIYNSLYQCATCGTPPPFVSLPNINIPYLSALPVVGASLFQRNILVYFSYVLAVAVAYFLTRTSFGLRVRAVGENPKAADNMGVNVNKVRFLATVFGAILAGLAGSYFSLDATYGVHSFQFDVIAGRGFIALAIVYLANWKPYRALFAAISYTLVYAIQTYITATPSIAIAAVSQLYNMLPYFYLLVLIPVLGRGARPPKFLLKPYRKG